MTPQTKEENQTNIFLSGCERLLMMYLFTKDFDRKNKCKQRGGKFDHSYMFVDIKP